MPKNRLSIDVSLDFSLLGINSSLPCYRLCWILNRCFDMKLERKEDIEVALKGETGEQRFPLYEYRDEQNYYSIEVIDNRNDHGVFLSELKNLDYLIKIRGEDDFFDTETFIEALNQIRGIQAVFPIDLEKIKSRNNLLLE